MRAALNTFMKETDTSGIIIRSQTPWESQVTNRVYRELFLCALQSHLDLRRHHDTHFALVQSVDSLCSVHSCYLRCKECLWISRVAWQDARRTCQRIRGGDLVSIYSATENDFIGRHISGPCWIGLNDLRTEGNFQWSDGSSFVYQNYSNNEPNDFHGQEDCVEIRSWLAGSWNDLNCGINLCYVCKQTKNTIIPDLNVNPSEPKPSPPKEIVKFGTWKVWDGPRRLFFVFAVSKPSDDVRMAGWTMKRAVTAACQILFLLGRKQGMFVEKEHQYAWRPCYSE